MAGEGTINIDVLLRIAADEARKQLAAVAADLRGLGTGAGEAAQSAITAGAAIDQTGTSAQSAATAAAGLSAAMTETVNAAANMTAEMGRKAMSTAAVKDAVTGLAGANAAAAPPVENLLQLLTRSDTAMHSAIASTTGYGAAISSLTGVIGAERDAMLAAGRARAEWQGQLDALRAKFNPLFAVSRQYEAQLRQIAEAEDMGAISALEAASARDRAAQAMAPLPGMVGNYGAAVNNASGYTANLFSQWNDIAVMMAAGQNPMQLALQQGTQVSQVLMQLGGGTTALRAIGTSFVAMLNPISLATIGIIAFGAAGVQWLGKLGKEGKTFDDALKDLNATLGNMRTNLDLVGDSRLEDTFGNLTGSVRGLARGMLELDRVSELKQFGAVIDGFLEKETKEGFGQILLRSLQVGMGAAAGDGMNLGAGLMGEDLKQGNIGANYAKLGAANSYEDFEARTEEIKKLAEAGEIEEVTQKLIELQQAMRGDGSFTGMTKELRALWSELTKTGIETAGLEAILNGTAQAEAIRHQVDQIVDANTRQAALSMAALQYGENSVQVEDLRAKHAREALRLKLEEMNVQQGSAEALRAQAALEKRLAADAETSAANRKQQQDEIMGGLQQQLDLTTAIQLYGERSEAVEALRAQNAWDVQEARYAEMGWSEQLIAQAQQLFELERQRAAEIRKAATARQADKLLADLREEAAINAAILRYGENSLQVKEMQIAAERRAFEQSLETMQLTEAQRRERLAAWDAARGLGSADPFGTIAAAGSYIRDQQERIDRLQLEQQLLGQNEAIRSRIVALWQVERDIAREGIDATSARAAEMRALALQEADLNEMLDRQRAAWGSVQSAAENAIDGIIDSLRSGDIEGALEGLADSFTSTLFELGVNNPFKNAILGTNLGTLQDVGGLQGIWNRLTGQAEVPEITAPQSLSAAAMTVTAGSVTINGTAAFAAAGSFPGAVAANSNGGGTLGGDWLSYANQGATRNQPISPDLEKAMSFLDEMGIRMEVFSGGQPSSGPNRVGSHRHDQGNAADVFFYRDGRRLDWNNPEDLPVYQQIVSRARANGVSGFGAGPGYMQPGSMHVGFGTPAVWGAGGAGANAPSWLQQAFNMPWNGAAGANPITEASTEAARALTSLGSQTITATDGLGTLGTGFDAFGQLLAGLGGGAGGTGGGGLLSMLGTGLAGALGIPGFATGGQHQGGLRIVGEKGPELEYTGPSTILPAELTRSVLGAKPPNLTINAATAQPQGSLLDRVVVNDYAGERIEMEERVAPNGQRQLSMTIGDQMARAMNQPGNAANKALKQRGVRQGVTRR